MTIKNIAGYAAIFVLGFLVCALILKTNYAPQKLTNAGFPTAVAGKGVASEDNAIQIASDKISKYVVNIDTVGKPSMMYPSSAYYQTPESVPMGTASGVIISDDGYILTNNHVVANASGVTVTLYNDKKYKAKIIGTDPRTDLAVVKIDANNLAFASFANSDKIAVGEWVIAVGNAFGMGPTVTSGIISAKRQNFDLMGQPFESLLQTDAAINGGNSGGALSDLNGNLVGINTAIATTPGGGNGNIGIGFAVPTNTAKKIAEELMKNGKVERPWIGIGYNGPMRSQYEAQGKKINGVLVEGVHPKGPAQKAGLRAGDIITKVNGESIIPKDDEDVQKAMNRFGIKVGKMKIGDTVDLTILRDKSEKNIKVKLGTMPPEEEMNFMLAPPKDSRMPRNPYGDGEMYPVPPGQGRMPGAPMPQNPPDGGFGMPFPPFFGQP